MYKNLALCFFRFFNPTPFVILKTFLVYTLYALLYGIEYIDLYNHNVWAKANTTFGLIC